MIEFVLGVVVGIAACELAHHPEWVTSFVAWVKSFRKDGDPPKS